MGAKYQIVSTKAVVQNMHYLSTNKTPESQCKQVLPISSKNDVILSKYDFMASNVFMQNVKNGQVHNAVILPKSIVMASIFFMQRNG